MTLNLPRFSTASTMLALLCVLSSGCHESRMNLDLDAGTAPDGTLPELDASPPPVEPDIDRSCAVDADCTPVLTGDPCGCSCEMSAINNDAVEAYRDYRNELYAMCEGPVINCIGCPPQEAFCSEGVCQINAPAPVGSN